MENTSTTQAAPYSAVQIANEFIARGVEDEIKDMTNMKIQKLVYFAHGYFLAIYDRPLIREEFEVWKHGPVVRQLYEKCKEVILQEGWKRDHSFNKPLKVQDDHIVRVRENDTDAICVVNSVWRSCKEYRASYLRRLTHFFDSPWTITLDRKGPYAIILNSDITDYFKNLMSAQ